jgi:hypothetical protein
MAHFFTASGKTNVRMRDEAWGGGRMLLVGIIAATENNGSVGPAEAEEAAGALVGEGGLVGPRHRPPSP